MEPTKRRNRLSVLARDPNLAETENGSLLYVRQTLEEGTRSIPNNFNLTISQKNQLDATLSQVGGGGLAR